MRSPLKVSAVMLLLLVGVQVVAAEYNNAGECLVAAYKKHKPARVVYWTQFHSQRIPNLPENRELRAALIQLATTQEDILEIELDYYLAHEGKNDRLMALAPFTVPYVRIEYVSEEDRKLLMKEIPRYAELKEGFASLTRVLAKYEGSKVQGQTQEGVDFFMNNVLPKLAADLAASRDSIANSCDAFYKQ